MVKNALKLAAALALLPSFMGATMAQEAKTAAPGRSGGEGGGSITNVTVAEATKEDPYLKTVVGQPSGAPTGNDPSSRCLRLAWQDFTGIEHAPTQIVDATVKPATDGAPAVCVVNGFIAPQVAFRIFMPLENWNERYLQNGCGGRCGELLPLRCEFKSREGYACLASDLGHRGTTYDNVWAIDDVPAEIDFGFRATHVASIVGKVITKQFYGRPHKHAYFIGASTGGRQALIEAQRFPEDFDGIVAGASGGITPGVIPGAGRRGPGGRALYDENGPVITTSEIRMLHRAVLKQCDGKDGLEDKIITDWRTCDFKPSSLLCKGAKTSECLTQKQVSAVDTVYATGPALGSEMAWIGAFVAEDGSKGRSQPRTSTPYSYPYSWVFNDSGNVDLRPFKATGGKLIYYTGMADEGLHPSRPSAYYETVERVVGSREETQDFFRLFIIPGQSHIPGNAGAESLDYLDVVQAWVEEGKAPDVIIGHKLKKITQMMGPVYYPKDLVPENRLYSRPHYPWPIQARYRGKGNPDDSASFGPWDPVTKKWVQ